MEAIILNELWGHLLHLVVTIYLQVRMRFKVKMIIYVKLECKVGAKQTKASQKWGQ
jgi:hypothetical protein